MALMRLAGGLELDLASGAELQDGLSGLESRLMGAQTPRPLFYTFPGQASGTGGLATISIGAPPAGRIWNILSVTIVGNDDHSTIASPAGFMAMYFGDPFNPSLGALAAVKLPLPGTTFFSAQALWCPSGQQVFLVSDKALNAPDQMVAVVSLAEWRSGDIEQLSGK